MKKLIADHIVKPFKRFPYFGRFRFWLLYWAYRITGWHIRNKEWDFVLEYLPKLHGDQKVRVLDVGCSRNLFCHEIVARGYELTGMDIEVLDFKYPGEFRSEDIRYNRGFNYDFVTCISVFEHISDDGKGDYKQQSEALKNMICSLKPGGRLLLTTPTKEFSIGHIWHGFTYSTIENILPENAIIIEYTEKAGQICMSITRLY